MHLISKICGYQVAYTALHCERYITEFIESKATETEKYQLKEPYIEDGKQVQIEVEKRKCFVCMNTNHPRVSRCVMDVRCLLDYLMSNYLRNLAEIYENT